MLVRHNTAYLEEAVRQIVRRSELPIIQAEAEAARLSARSSSLRRLATAAAIAIIAIGLGLGFYLMNLKGFERPPAVVTANTDMTQKPPVVPPPQDSQVDPNLPPVPQPPEPKVVKNRVEFQTTDVQFNGSTWKLETGHQYASDADAMWQTAWCYTRRQTNGVQVQVDLVNRTSPSATPIAPVASPETLSGVGLTPLSAIALATNCPWNDGKHFSVSDFILPENKKNPFDRIEPPKLERKGDILSYSGFIGPDFAAMLGKEQFSTLEIDSAGGLIQQALVAGRWLRQHRISVVAKNNCLSACVLVLAGGYHRKATETADIGVHRFYGTNALNPDEATDVAQQIASEIVGYLGEMDIDVKLFQAMSSVPSSSISILPHPQLIEWRLLEGDYPEIETSPLPNDSKADTKKTDPPPPNVPPLISFNEYDKFDLVGNDLQPFNATGKNDCVEACQKNSSCKAITYNNWSKACYLKSAGGTLKYNPILFTSVIATEQVTKSDLPLSIFKKTNRAFTIAPYKTTGVMNYGTCSDQCLADKACDAFNFKRPASTCEFFSNPTQYSQSSNSDIGIKQQ